MAMLYGLDTSFLDPSDPNNTAEINQLNNEYNQIMSEYGIAPTTINSFWKSQLVAQASDKLPANCP
jgi:hypothetical protein